ncbi:MAG: DUF2851 family protein [Salinivirgaceae bacterium]
MDEKFLHHIWKYKLFDCSALKTATGEPISVLSVGIHNQDAGPDFFNARVKIGETEWAGCVEIHIKASDWNVHGHNSDKAYDNVILHLVAVNDKDIERSNGSVIPTAELRYNSHYANNYKMLQESKQWISCEEQFATIDETIRRLWLETLLVRRLERKSSIVRTYMAQTNNDFDEVFFRMLCRNLGFKTNAEPFEQLSRKVNLRMVRSIGKNVKNLESLLFGAAGFLEEDESEYQQQLQTEYRHLANRFQITSLPPSIWKFARMRPVSFPTLRIAQLAEMLSRKTQFTAFLKEAQELEEVVRFFEAETGDFWLSHYTFAKASKPRAKTLGKTAIHNIIINSVFPFLFTMGHYYGSSELQDKVMRWMEKLPPEKNHIIDNWRSTGATVSSAYESQAYIELYNEFCTPRNCLNCRLGGYIIKES